MAQQWIRKISLVVEGAQGSIELSALRVRFHVFAHTNIAPSTLEARIFNLNPDSEQKLLTQIVDPLPSLQGSNPNSGAGKVTLQAGYEENYGTIFKGELIQVRRGREGLDTYIDLFAGDGDRSHNWAVINTTLAAGWTPHDVNDQIRKAMSTYDVTAGNLPDAIPATAAPRGKVVMGMARDTQRDLSNQFNADGFVRNGNLEWLERSAYRPGDIAKINAQTGMIGLPQQTNFGLTVRMLLNPSVGPGTLLQLQNKSIQQLQASGQVGAVTENTYLQKNLNYDFLTAADGNYRVFAVEHIGDTRANDWYSDAICVATSSGIPGGAAFLVPKQYLGSEGVR
jgi:hypothetical protein